MISRKSGVQTLPCGFVSFHNTSILDFLVWISVSTCYSSTVAPLNVFLSPTCRAWQVPNEFPISLLRFVDDLCTLFAFRIDEVDAPRIVEHCRVLASQWPILAFLAFWLLLTCQSKSQATDNQVWQLLVSWSGAPLDHINPGGGFSTT